MLKLAQMSFISNGRLFFLLSLLMPVLSSAQGLYELPANLKNQIQGRIEKGWHLSTVIGIVTKSGTSFYGFGQQSLVDSKSPDEHSLFAIASLTKSLTATLLMDMDHRGEIDINSPLADFLPTEIEVPTYDGKPILLSHLLAHSSGLPREPYNMDFSLGQQRYAKYTHAQMYHFLSDVTLEHAIGSDTTYSNLGYALLGLVVELYSDRSFESLVVEHIANVLDMPDTRITLSDAQRSRLAQGVIDGKAVVQADMGLWTAMGSFYSTADDLAHFLKANIGIMESPLEEAIASSQIARAPHFELADGQLSYAWEIIMSGETGNPIHYFKGQVDGYVAFIGFDRSKKIGVVMLNSGRRYFSDIPLHILDSTYPILDPPANSDWIGKQVSGN